MKCFVSDVQFGRDYVFSRSDKNLLVHFSSVYTVYTLMKYVNI